MTLASTRSNRFTHRVKRVGLLAGSLSAITCFGGAVSSAQAATTIPVTSTADAALSNPAATTCPSTCSLREAVQVADNVGGAVTITLPAGTYTYALPDTASGQTDNPEVGDLDVNSGVTLSINGAGASTTLINPAHIDRAFAVQSGGNLSLSDVTIENGLSNSGTVPSEYSDTAGNGGAIYNDGALSISGSVLTSDSVSLEGGAIYADTSATSTSITNSTVDQVSADSEGGAGYISSGPLTLTGDTIVHNSADSDGGAFAVYQGANTQGPVTISGSTLSDNTADSDGGALYIDGATALTVSDSVLNHNITSDEDGGAIYDDSTGTPITITNTTATNNDSGDGSGGFLYGDNSDTITVSGSTFVGDSAGDSEGGVVYADGSDLTVTGSTFQGGSGDEGGALYVDGTSATAAQTISNSSFTGNVAVDDEGGAIYDDKGALSINGSSLIDNSSSYYGGALYYDSDDALHMTNDTLDGNQAVEGGAIELEATVSSGTISFLNDTIAHNTAYQGGGIDAVQHATSVENTIIADNSGGTSTSGGGDCYGTAAMANAGSADIGGNVDSDGSCFSSSVTTDKVGVNPLLASAADNGGPQLTDALQSGSPAIGAAVASACPATDERGVTRPTACDAGAFQTANADLATTVSAPSSGPLGSPVTYTFTVTNDGSGPATGVTFKDTLPSGASYFGSTSSQGSCTGTTSITCSLGVLDSSATGTTTTATVTVTVLPQTAGSLADTGTVSASTNDPNSANNSATGTVNVPATATSVTTVTTMVNLKPLVAAGAASKLRATRVYISGFVNPAGLQSTYYFQVRRTGTTAWRTLAHRTLVAATTTRHVGITAMRLKHGRSYAFRLVARNSAGTGNSQVGSFKTKS